MIRTAVLLVAIAFVGCAGSGTDSSPTTHGPSDRSKAARAWRHYLRPILQVQAASAQERLVKLDTGGMNEPTDYGQGFKQAAGTAYAEFKTPEGLKYGKFYSAELRDTGGRWHVQPDSLKEEQPP